MHVLALCPLGRFLFSTDTVSWSGRDASSYFITHCVIPHTLTVSLSVCLSMSVFSQSCYLSTTMSHWFIWTKQTRSSLHSLGCSARKPSTWCAYVLILTVVTIFTFIKLSNLMHILYCCHFHNICTNLLYSTMHISFFMRIYAVVIFAFILLTCTTALGSQPG